MDGGSDQYCMYSDGGSIQYCQSQPFGSSVANGNGTKKFKYQVL